MQIRIVDSLPDGRPARVRFRFTAPLEAAQYDFRVFRGGELVPFVLGPIGLVQTLPPEDFAQVLLSEVLRW
ncbi:hypothetical protein D3C83_135310 [compost metagenome]